MVKKQHIANGIQKIAKSIVKLLVFSVIFSENLNFRSRCRSCVSYYDCVVNRNVT